MKLSLVLILAVAVIVVGALAVYDRLVVRPALQIGLIDIGEIYRIKEREFTERVAQAASDAERENAIGLAEQFARALPRALEELPGDCHCLVLVRNAVAAQAPNTIDLTPRLKQKLGIER